MSQEAEERHRQALWADEGTNGASFIDENEQEEGGGIIGNDELQGLPTWRLVLRRVVDHDKFQVRYKSMLIILFPSLGYYVVGLRCLTKRKPPARTILVHANFSHPIGAHFARAWNQSGPSSYLE